MAEETQFKLKDPQTVRVFMSSPFNGMEQERKSLAKFYWPKLESLLATRGLKLRLVDLRWGITGTSCNESQTVNICLREVERSDIFIGFYGQRYGWHGKEDTELQNNLEVCKNRFPWVQKYASRSVTELEYRLGHLNNPGEIPACFCFRKKSYDDKMKAEALKMEDLERAGHFSMENPEAKRLLDNLKQEVKDSKKDTLGVLMDYVDPEDAVRYVYGRVQAFVEEKILFERKLMSEREKSVLAHKSFLESRCGIYVGGEKYFDELDRYVNEEGATQPLTVLGTSGSGKSALLANWTKKHTTENPRNTIFYHFVGCEPESTKRTNLMQRLIENMHLVNTGEEAYETLTSLDERHLMTKLQRLLSEEADYNKQASQKVVIIVDRLDQLNYSRTSKPLFWLPKVLPANLRVIVTVTTGSESSDEVLSVLNDDFGTRQMQMLPLMTPDCLLLSKAILDENSKSLEKNQLDMIVASPKTKNPFFLHVLINELCVMGNFRQLDRQIKALLATSGVHGLLCQVLRRVDKDYKLPEHEENTVERILCAIALSRNGLYDIEIPYAQHEWAPVIYAMEKFLINRSGLIKFSFSEMTAAIQTYFLDDKEKMDESAKHVAEIFLQPYKKKVEKHEPVDKRIALEVPYHLKACYDKTQMIEVLGNIDVFNLFYESSGFDLNEYWKFTGLRSDAIAQVYIENIEPYFANKDRELFETTADTVKRKTKQKVEILEDMISWMDTMKHYHGLSALQDYLMKIEEDRSDISPLMKLSREVQAKYSKACLLSDAEKYVDALTLHQEVLEGRIKLLEEGLIDQEACAMSYNGIGLCYYHLGHVEEARGWFTKALEVRKYACTPSGAVQCAGTYTNLGLVYVELDQLPQAYECFQQSNDMIEIVSPSQITLEVAFNYHNMAMLEKKRMNFDAAEWLYQKSLKIKGKLLGRESHDVAITMMNIGTLWAHKRDYQKSLMYNEMSLKILKKVALSDSRMIFLAQENVVNALLCLGRKEEAEPLYRKVFEYQKEQPGGIANGMVHVHRKMISYYCQKKEGEKAAEIAIDLLTSPEAHPTDLAKLIMADRMIAPEKRVGRPPEATFEHGIKKWPNHREILRAKMIYTLHLEPNNFINFIASYCEGAEGEGGYNLLIDISEKDLQDEDLARKLVVLGLRAKPNNTELKAKLQQLMKVDT